MIEQDRLDDGASALDRIAGLEDARAHKDGLCTEFHHEGGVCGSGDATGAEVGNRQPAQKVRLPDHLKRSLHLLCEHIKFVLTGSVYLANLSHDRPHVPDGFHDVSGTCFALGTNHRSTLGATAQRFSQVSGSANERNRKGVLIDVVLLVSGGEDFAFVDEIDFERLEDFGLHEVADAALGHDRNRDDRLNALDHLGIAHAGHSTIAPDVGGHALQRHHGDSACILGDTSLFGVDDIHDDAAFEHFRQADLFSPSLLCRGPCWSQVIHRLRTQLYLRAVFGKVWRFGPGVAIVKAVKGLTLSFFAFTIGCVAVIALAPKPTTYQPSPQLAYGQPQARTQFRSQQRLSEDGAIPANPWFAAKAERDKRVGRQALRAGVSPSSWTFLGPTNVGGRIRAVVVHPTNPNTMWIGSCGGGIWKTTDAGTTWSPWVALDDFLPGIAVSTMVIDPSNPNVLYAGTGEGFFETEEGTTNTACIRGAGIFKTTDGGATWNQLPSTTGPDFYYVNRLVVAPGNPSTMLAACSTGIWRSTNAGATWTKVLANEWVYDVDFHPTDASKAIAGTHENGAFYSNDGGLTWTRSVSITAHRTEISYAPSNPATVYATVGNANLIRVWRSTNGGVTFSQLGAATISTYEAYNNALWVNPTNPAQLLYGGVYVYRSNDSGASRAQAFTNIHPDIHAFVSHPQYNGTTNKTLFVATDGGLFRINDPSGTTSNVAFFENMGITQFYGAAINPVSGRIMGGTQDNGTRLYTGNINNWTQSAGGDGGYNATDPLDANYFYGNIYWALHFRSTNGGTVTNYIYQGPNPITDADNANLVNFENYFILDPNNVNRLLVCAQRLWRTNNAKAAQPDWFVIKPSIAPPSRPGRVGGGNAHFAPNNPYNISTVAVAPGNSDVIWVGHNNGHVYMTTNGTATSPTWTRVDTTGPLPGRWVSRIVVDPLNANHVYVAFMGWHDDSIWETTNAGLSWTDIASGKLIPASVNVLALHPTQPGWLYAGTDLGLFTTSNNGGSWSAVTAGPGTCAVEEIVFKNPTSMVIATYGRGMYQATLAAPTDTLDLTSAAVDTGLNGFGNLTNVLVSDNRAFGAYPDYSTDRSRLPVQLDFNAHSPVASPTALSVTVESSASAGGSTTLSLFDYSAGTWRAIDTRPVLGTDTTYTVSAPAPANRFVGPSGAAKIRVGFTNPTGPRSWTGSVDRLSGVVTP